METGYSKWRKLDNAAIAFPLVTGRNDSRVFRFYCQLKEEVDPDILQSALDQTMEKYPLFQAVLRKGLFWFYLERREIKALVKPERKPPCSQLYIPDQKSLLFRVKPRLRCRQQQKDTELRQPWQTRDRSRCSDSHLRSIHHRRFAG